MPSYRVFSDGDFREYAMFLASYDHNSIKFVYWILDLSTECKILTCGITMIMKYSNSSTLKDLVHQIPKLPRTYSVFKDFPGPGKMANFFRTFNEVWLPGNCILNYFPYFSS